MILPLFQGFFRRAIGVIFTPAIPTKCAKAGVTEIAPKRKRGAIRLKCAGVLGF